MLWHVRKTVGERGVGAYAVQVLAGVAGVYEVERVWSEVVLAVFEVGTLRAVLSAVVLIC